MKPLKKSISTTLDEDRIEKVKEKAEDRSVSQYINLVLRAYFRGLGKKQSNGAPLQAP